MSLRNQAEDPKRKFNFDELIEEAIDRNRKIRSSPFLQGKILNLQEGLYDNDEDFYNSDEGHVYNTNEFELNPDHLETDLYSQSELEPNPKDRIQELVQKVEQYCNDNYNEEQNPELFSACNELLSAFYKFKAKGRPDTSFGPCVLEIYRNIKTNKSNSLSNQFSTEDIFESLEELNQLLGKLEQTSMVHNPFRIGY